MSIYRRTAIAVGTAMTLFALSACSAVGEFGQPAPAKAAATPAVATPTETIFDSQFTKDGTYQSHIEIDGIDFVYTIWPTKSTPRTNEWFPLGNKYFSFTLTAYDLDRDLRDKFRTKRRVYLSRIRITSATTAKSGAVETPYRLDANASRITFDPEPVRSRRGMLITSPKGAFELRNQKIGELALDTRGVTLTFEATVHMQRSKRSKRFDTDIVREEVPISIFKSDEPTKEEPIPINAN